MGDTIGILIADDHAILRDGLRKLLEAEADFAVVGEACNGHDALTLTRRLRPDVVLLDLAMPGLPGLEVLRALAAVSTSTRTILLTANIERSEVVKALQLGARGVVMKDAATDLLMKAIRSVVAGQYWIGRESASEVIETLRSQMFEKTESRFGLTPRELEIVGTVAAGYSNKEIAKRCALSEETVKHHLTKIFSKVGVANRLELALFAISQRLVDR